MSNGDLTLGQVVVFLVLLVISFSMLMFAFGAG